MKVLLGLVVFCLLTGTHGLVTGGKSALRSKSKEPAASESVIKPLSFDQRLLVCNAYPHKTPVKVSKNKGDEVLPGGGLKFNECEYASTGVKAHDKLDFELADLGVEGTFEVGTLPESDAVLLLVLEKRDAKSSVVAFQSFAFPSSKDADESAQLAVIDTYKGEARMPHLKMSDHISGQKDKDVSKRVEELNFNRVYAVEGGSYDASVMDTLEDKAAEKKVEKFSTMLKLDKGKDYVVIRTGDDKDFPQSLIAFPPASSSAAKLATGLVGLVLACIAQLL